MPHINNSKNSAHTHIESSYNKYLRTYNLHIDWLGEKMKSFSEFTYLGIFLIQVSTMLLIVHYVLQWSIV